MKAKIIALLFTLSLFFIQAQVAKTKDLVTTIKAKKETGKKNVKVWRFTVGYENATADIKSYLKNLYFEIPGGDEYFNTLYYDRSVNSENIIDKIMNTTWYSCTCKYDTSVMSKMQAVTLSSDIKAGRFSFYAIAKPLDRNVQIDYNVKIPAYKEEFSKPFYSKVVIETKKSCEISKTALLKIKSIYDLLPGLPKDWIIDEKPNPKRDGTPFMPYISWRESGTKKDNYWYSSRGFSGTMFKNIDVDSYLLLEFRAGIIRWHDVMVRIKITK